MTRTPPTLNSLRIMVSALLIGTISLTGTFVALQSTSTAPPAASGNTVEVFALMAGSLGAGALAGFFAFPRILVRQGAVRLRQTLNDDEKAAMALRTMTISTILRCALVEGPGLFGAVVYFITGQWAFLIAPALAIPLMLSQFPSEWKLQSMRDALEREAALMRS